MNNLRDEEADRMIRANGEAEAARLREMEGEVSDYRQSLDGLKKSVESLGDVKEFAHKENVRVYRNVQASLQEELEKRNAELSEEITLQNEALTRLVSSQRDELQQTLSRQSDEMAALLKDSGSVDQALEKSEANLKAQFEQGNNELREELKALISSQNEAIERLREMISEQDNTELIESLKEEMGVTADGLKGDLQESGSNNAERIIGDVSAAFEEKIPADLGKVRDTPLQLVTFGLSLINTVVVIVLMYMIYFMK